MQTTLDRLDALLRRLDLSGLSDVALSGQIVQNEWHAIDCSMVGAYNSPVSPFPWSYLEDKMTAPCCTEDIMMLAGELSPPSLTSIVRVLVIIDESLEKLRLYRDDVAVTPFADLSALDAAVDFQSELDDIVTLVTSRTLGVHGRHLGQLDAELKILHQTIEEVRTVRYRDTEFLDSLFQSAREVLSIERDDTEVLVCCKAAHRSKPEHLLADYLLQGLTTTFALDAYEDCAIAMMPRWAYEAMRKLGGEDWISSPYDGLSPAIVETAKVLWDRDPVATMHDFDACVEAALAL